MGKALVEGSMERDKGKTQVLKRRNRRRDEERR